MRAWCFWLPGAALLVALLLLAGHPRDVGEQLECESGTLERAEGDDFSLLQSTKEPIQLARAVSPKLVGQHASAVGPATKEAPAYIEKRMSSEAGRSLSAEVLSMKQAETIQSGLAQLSETVDSSANQEEGGLAKHKESVATGALSSHKDMPAHISRLQTSAQVSSKSGSSGMVGVILLAALLVVSLAVCFWAWRKNTRERSHEIPSGAGTGGANRLLSQPIVVARTSLPKPSPIGTPGTPSRSLPPHPSCNYLEPFQRAAGPQKSDPPCPVYPQPVQYSQPPSVTGLPQTRQRAGSAASSAVSMLSGMMQPQASIPEPVPSGRSAETRYNIPLEEVTELSTYLNAGWFNIVSAGGEPVFHVEIALKNGSRVLEVSKVYAPGRSEILASVAPSTALTSQGALMDHRLPPQVLQVCLSGGKPHATIQSWGNGTYAVMKDGQKAFTIIGDAATLELSVISARTGRPAATIVRSGMKLSEVEYIELVVQPGWPSACVFILACVLSVVTLRSWPTRSPVETEAEHEATKPTQHPHLFSVVSDSPRI